MILITRKTLARGAADKYREQYADKPYRVLYDGTTAQQTLDRLVALGSSPTPEDVDAAIGNASWTVCLCNECGDFVDRVVAVGCYNGHPSAQLCIACLDQALGCIDDFSDEIEK